MEGGGESGARLRSTDWARTLLGPIERWPRSLKALAGSVLHARQPMVLLWGPELSQIYNDAFVPGLGKGKHPAAMGQRAAESWAESWPWVGAQINDVMTQGKVSFTEDRPLPTLRNGRLERVYWSWGFSPVFGDDGRRAGALVVGTETTARVLLERRLRMLRSLGEKTAGATTTSLFAQAIDDAFNEDSSDVPFALVFLFEGAADEPKLLQASAASPLRDAGLVRDLGARLRDLAGQAPLSNEESKLVTHAGSPGPVTEVFVAKLHNLSTARDAGFLVFGLSPVVPFDAAYQGYLIQLTERLSRVYSRLEAAQARASVEAERTNLLLQAPFATAVLHGPTHVFTLANPLYCRLAGRSDLVGKSYAEAFPELVSTALPGVLDHVYRTGEPFATNEYQVELEMHQGSGVLEERFIKFNLEALRDGVGRVYGVMAVALDITEQVVARRVLEQAQLERERLLRDLESANRAKDEFLAMLGHELRNPLAPITTAVQLMKVRQEPGLERERLIIERQVGHLGRLVDDLLDVSRIAHGLIELKRRPVEMSEVLLKAIELASPLLEQRAHALDVQVPRAGLLVDGDPVRLAQVFANLVTNAAKYTRARGRISIAAERLEEQIVVRVTDNGMGISAELLPTVFELFVQGRRTLDRGEGGLGLGLALVKNLVGLHGGTVLAQSAGLDRGSQFTVRLPALGQAEPPLDSSEEPLRLGQVGRQKRVLVVDDNLDAAEMLSEALRAAGHEVATAHDGVQALELLRDFEMDVGVLDLGLPIMDGFELARQILERGGSSLPRLIALTGYGQEQDVARSKAAGFEKHLVKPVDLDVVLKAIEGG